MSRRHRLYSVAVLLVLVVVACGDAGDSATGDEVVVVTSDDGQLTLSVDPSALPEGALQDEIRVRRLDPTSIDLPSADGEVIAAYGLEPDGIKFSTPITLTSRLDLEPGDQVVDVQLIGSDGTPQPLEVSETSFDVDGRLKVEFEVTHFSTLVYSIRATRSRIEFLLKWQVPDEVVVDVPFRAQVTINSGIPAGGELIYREKDQRRAVVYERPWTLGRGGFFGQTVNPKITPWHVPSPPAAQAVGGASFTTRATLTCTEAGAEGLRYAGSVFYRFVEFDINEDGTRSRRLSFGRNAIFTSRVAVTCVWPPPPTTTTSTTTATTTVPDTTTTTPKVGAAGLKVEFFAEFAPAAEFAEDCIDFAEDMVVEFGGIEGADGILGFALELADGLPGLAFTLDPDGRLIVDEVALSFGDDVVFLESFSLDLVAGTGTYSSEASDPDFGAPCEFDVLFDPGGFDDQK